MEGNEKKDWGNFGWKLPVEKNEERVGNGRYCISLAKIAALLHVSVFKLEFLGVGPL